MDILSDTYPEKLWGRHQLVEQIIWQLQDNDCRLLNLCGPVGMGKTRIAVELVADERLKQHFAAGMVAMTLKGKQGNLCQLIAEKLEHPHLNTWPQLADLIASQNYLIVLDAFEDRIDEDAENLEQLLDSCPKLVILITSQEVLNVDSEYCLRLEGLSLPQGAEMFKSLLIPAQDQAKPLKEEAAELSQLEMESIVHLLEGWPLGIVMAAEQARDYRLSEVYSQLSQGFAWLERKNPASPQHQSARSAFESMWQRLSWHEQRLFRQLAIFGHSFSYEAAESILDIPVIALDRLVDMSLLRFAQDERYYLHPMIHSFIAEKLRLRVEEKRQLERIHAEYYYAFADLIEDNLSNEDSKNWLDELLNERENLLIALEWAKFHKHWPMVKGLKACLQRLRQRQANQTNLIDLLSPATFLGS